MMKIVKRFNVNSTFIIFVLLTTIYGVSTRFYLEITSLTNQVQYNFWDLFFQIHANVFFLMYILIPISIFISLKRITDDWNYNVLIRLSSYSDWLIYNLMNSIQYILIIQGLLIASIWSISFQFPIENQWSSYSNLSIFTKDMSESNNSPLYFAIIQISYVSLFFLNIFLCFSLVIRIIHKKSWLFGLGFFIYIFIIILDKYTSNEYFNIMNYIIVQNSYIIFPFLMYPVLFFLILLGVILFWEKLKR